MRLVRCVILLKLLATLLLPNVTAQSVDQTNTALLEASTMTINGSSTLHSWNVSATRFSVQFKVPSSWFESAENWNGSDISELSVSVPVEALDGGKNRMNRDLRDALRYPEHETISFEWDSLAFTGRTDTGRRATVEGSVTVAGVTQSVAFTADLGLNEWSKLVVTGSVDLNMRDFDIDPPTALFGVIRTDEEITLEFELVLGID